MQRALPATLLLLVVSCASPGPAWTDIGSPTTAHSSAIASWDGGLGSARRFGYEVETIGGSTVVTQHLGTRSRRFTIEAMTGYSGRLAQAYVELDIAGNRLWIDEDTLEFEGPDFVIDLDLSASPADDPFGGRDLILWKGSVEAIDE